MSMPYSSSPRRKVRNSPPAWVAARAASCWATCRASVIMSIVVSRGWWGCGIGVSGEGRLDAEGADDLVQADRLVLEAFGGGGRFLDERGVLLRHPVELADGGVDLADAGALLGS